MPSAKPQFNPDKPFKAVKPEFDPSKPFETTLDEDDVEKTAPLQKRVEFGWNVPKTALQAMGTVPELLRVVADSAVAGQPLGTNLDRYYKADPTYEPGDATVEKFSDNHYTQTVLKTGLDFGLDPTVLAGPFSKAKLATEALKETVEKPSLFLRAMGALGNFTTGGRISPKWAKSAAQFSPTEQIFAGKTLKKVTEEYQPLKKAAETQMAGRGATFPPFTEVGNEKAFESLDTAIQSIDDALGAIKRSGEPDSNVIRTLSDRLKEIRGSGTTDAAELGEILKTINNLEYTGFDNPKMVREIFQGPQIEARRALDYVQGLASPELAGARRTVNKALNMVAPQKGGLVSKYIIQNMPMLAGSAGAIGEAMQGDVDGAIKTFVAGALLKSPKTWNVVSGAARLPAGLAKSGMEGLTTYFAQHPDAFKASVIALSQLPKADLENVQKDAMSFWNIVGKRDGLTDPNQAFFADQLANKQMAQQGMGGMSPMSPQQATPKAPPPHPVVSMALSDPEISFMIANQMPPGITPDNPAFADALSQSVKSNPGIKSMIRQRIKNAKSLTDEEKSQHLSDLNGNNF